MRGRCERGGEELGREGREHREGHGGDGMVGEGSVEYGSGEGRERRRCEGRVGRGRD